MTIARDPLKPATPRKAAGLALSLGLAFWAAFTAGSAFAQSGPFCSTFDNNNTEGWAACSAQPQINVSTTTGTTSQPNSTGDPSDYYLLLEDLSGASAACNTSDLYTGDWIKKFGECAQFCFDFKLFHAGSPPAPVTPSFSIYSGSDRAVFAANFTVTASDPWKRICAPIRMINPGENPPSNSSGQWIISGSGNWNSIITAVTMVQLPIDFTSQPSEVAGYDNFCVEGVDCASITIQKSVDWLYTFDFTTSGAGLSNFSLTPANNSTAATTFNNLSPGSFTVAETAVPGYDLIGLSCTGDIDGGNVIDLANGVVTIDLDAGENQTCTFTNVESDDPVDVAQCLETEAEVTCNPDGTVTVTVNSISPAGFSGGTIEAITATPGVTVSPAQQTLAPGQTQTQWILTGGMPGQTVTLMINQVEPGGGSQPGVDLCCSGEVEIVIPDCPPIELGEVIVEKKVVNNTHASTAAIDALIFPIALTCDPPSTINASVSLNDGGSYTENNVPYGSLCSVTEAVGTLPPAPLDACEKGFTAVWATPVITPPSPPGVIISAPITVFTVVNELNCVKGEVGRLSITKLVSPDPLGTGNAMLFPATVMCTNPAASYPVTLHGNTSTVPISLPLGSQCSVTETLPPLPPGCSWLAPVYSPATVIIGGGIDILTVTNAYRCEPPPKIDVAIEKKGEYIPLPDMPPVGSSNLSFALTVTNVGAGFTGANVITVTDVVSAGMTFNTATGPNWTCVTLPVPAGGTMTCTYTGSGPTGPGAPLGTITIGALTTVNGPWENCASVDVGSAGVDSNPDDNKACVTVTEKPDGILTVEKKVDNRTQADLSGWQYPVTVNCTPTPSASFNLADGGSNSVNVPLGVDCTVTEDPQNVILPPSEKACREGLVPQWSVTISPAGPAHAGDTVVVENLLECVKSDIVVPQPPKPVAAPDLSIEKSGPSTCEAGEPCRFTITVTNVGNGAFEGPIFVRDEVNLPGAQVSAATSGWSCSAGTCVHATLMLAPGDSAMLTVNVEVPSSARKNFELQQCAALAIPMPGDEPVRFVQQMLTATGIDVGAADNQIGRRTRAAIEAFRQSAGLPGGSEIDAALLAALSDLVTADANSDNDRACADARITKTIACGFGKRLVGETCRAICTERNAHWDGGQCVVCGGSLRWNPNSLTCVRRAGPTPAPTPTPTPEQEAPTFEPETPTFEPEMPTCPFPQVFNPATGRCVGGEQQNQQDQQGQQDQEDQEEP